ncbi:hypothetical protein [Photobacterium damselae]|uniref:hypothetical protein n=1 Tax=Photobacterium damselae TaxID=38293 RepID=UPI0040676AEF
MTWDDTFQIITASLGAVGSSAIIILSLSSWLGKVWANRILEQDKFRYSQELESLRISSKNLQDSLSLTNATYFETKKAYAEKRVYAITEVWREFVEFRENYPSEIIWLDILAKDEYNDFFNDSRFASFKERTDLAIINTIIPKKLDILRPFMDDITYQLFFMYVGIIARLCFYLNKCCDGNVPEYDWREDDGVVRILSTGLSEVEYHQFQTEKWSVQILLNFLQSRISNHLKNIATGSDLAKEAMDHSLAFSKELTEICQDEIIKKANKVLSK